MKMLKLKNFMVFILIILLIIDVKTFENLLEKSITDGPIPPLMNSYSPIFSSFLGTKETLEEKTEEMSKISSYMKEMLMTQQASRKKKRYTEDGRICSPAFAQDGQTFFDCTATRSPDGQNKNKEWCYVDAAAKGTKPWEYCRPIMDYDKIREENQEQLKQFTIRARKCQSDIEAQIQPGQQALDSLKRVRQGQGELDQKINQLITEISTITNNMQNLFNTKEQWEQEEEKAVSLATSIKLRQDKQKEDEANNKPMAMDKSEETVKKETSSNKITISGMIQERITAPSFDCNGMLNYEEDSSGDGLIGMYYDNESFLGDYKEVKDPNIDFDWTGASPTEGVNPSNFSIRWESFIFAPVTSNYQFAIECDGGATITVNNQLIVSHNMFTAAGESKDRVDKWLSKEVEKRNNPGKNFNKSTSAHVKLSGGSKFKIVVSYYHSIHTDLQGDNKSFVRLYWQSDDFDERIVCKNNFYTQNSFSPLKLSGFTEDQAVVRKLLPNDLAFKNSEQYILYDIPTDYRGLTSMKLNLKYLDKELTFSTNIPSIVYMGRLAHYPNPVPNDFENTGDFMTLLQIEKPNINNPKKIVSNRSALVKIYKKKFDAGKVKIPLNRKSINVKGIPLIVFFGFDSANSSPVSCGGDEAWISNPNSSHFKACTESSYYDANWRCRNSLYGRAKDVEGSTWATKREGIGAWLKVEFKQLYQVTKIQYWDRRNPSERNSKIVATFSSGEEYEMKLKNTDEMQEFKLEGTFRATDVKFLIKEIYGTINNGGSFKVFGTKCIDADDIDKSPTPEVAKGIMQVAGINPKALAPLFKVEDKKPINLTCKDSISNSKKLDHIKKKPGNKVTVKCMENCAGSPYSIYGDGKYTKDSAICKAAYHSQKLKAEGGLLQIEFGAGQILYRGKNKNGIKSKSKIKSDLTVTFDTMEGKQDIILDSGAKVDIFEDGKWLPGVINRVKDLPEGKTILVAIEGAESTIKPIEVSYPNASKVKACGDKVKDRDCKGSRKQPNTNKPIKIKFVPSSYNKPGDFLLDKGETFGKGGKAYGWSKDMAGRIKTRQGASKPEMETLVEFPPSPKSKFCSKPSPDVMCDKVNWSVKVGHGKFNVKLYVGDPQANTRIDLKINDQYIVQGKTIPKNQLKIYEGAYDSINEYLTISPDCERDCEYAMSKMNMIELFPFADEARKEPDVAPEKKDPCGNAVTGGRCDKGPDVTHCLFSEPNNPGAKFCTGNLLMVQVSKQNRCASQRGKFKCVKRKYANQGECSYYCPGKCTKGMCL